MRFFTEQVISLLFLYIQLFNTSPCHLQKYKSILRGNYQNVLQVQNGPLLLSKYTNTFWGGQQNGLLFRDAIYLVTGGVGFTTCAYGDSIKIELRQAYELNTLKFWLWDRNIRTYNFVVYLTYDNTEKIIYDQLAETGVVQINFPDQLVKQFRIYNRNGNTENTGMYLIKIEAYYQL